MLLKFGGLEHQGRKSSSKRTEGNTNRDAPGGGSWYVKYHGLGNTEECVSTAPELAARERCAEEWR